MSSKNHSSYHTLADLTDTKTIIPALTTSSHKGSSGRIGVIGGSPMYTGAPYYAGMAALRVGVDLCSILCDQAAAVPIKCYSPELMVQPVYDIRKEEPIEDCVARIVPHLERWHCLLVGPGLGRDARVFDVVEQVLHQATLHDLWIVLDADALFMLSSRSILQDYAKLVLTPNAVEYRRLFDGQNNRYPHALVIHKGAVDHIVSQNKLFECHEPGGLKRAGGIGDVLSGTVAGFMAWQAILENPNPPLAALTACAIVKRATRRAYEKCHRSMSAQDVLEALGPVFHEAFEDTKASGGNQNDRV